MERRPSEVSVLDRGLQFGEGVFETIACLNGRPRFLPLHLERLEFGCERLGIQPPGQDEIAAEIRGLVSGVERAIVKLLVTGGEAVARGYARSGSERATRITIRYPWPHEDRRAVARWRDDSNLVDAPGRESTARRAEALQPAGAGARARGARERSACWPRACCSAAPAISFQEP